MKDRKINELTAGPGSLSEGNNNKDCFEAAPDGEIDGLINVLLDG